MAVGQWLLCALRVVWVVSVAVGGGVCFLYVTAASYCTVALNQVDLARNVRRRLLRLQRRRRLVESVRVGFEWLWRRGCLCRWS